MIETKCERDISILISKDLEPSHQVCKARLGLESMLHTQANYTKNKTHLQRQYKLVHEATLFRVTWRSQKAPRTLNSMMLQSKA
ncbi:hypothetical protein BpHYR1_009518 [Brachionus plicatilis]|uniref:Uncharacterized protein n=1 Tax=Brachionus plicatilis TaxID=10195 RepID=A0A3M7SUD8_BRAPC|nr:hypothetical protein BpHYR1_009518 [Brachionus plicatilis]